MSKNEATASVFDLLKADHRKVEKLFAALEHAEGEEKVSLALFISRPEGRYVIRFVNLNLPFVDLNLGFVDLNLI